MVTATQKATKSPEPDLVDRVGQWLVAQGLLAADKLTEFQRDTRQEFGGELTYVHKTSPTEKAEKIRQLLANFNGRNPTTLARELRIGRSTVYAKLKQAQNAKRRETTTEKLAARDQRRHDKPPQ